MSAGFGTTAAGRELRLGGLLDLVRLLGPNLGKLLDILKGINVGSLGDLLAALKQLWAIQGPWDDDAVLLARIEAGLKAIIGWTRITPGVRDDELIDAVTGWLTTNRSVLTGLVAVVTRLLGMLKREGPAEGETVVVFSAANAEIECAEFSSLAITASWDWGQLLSLARILAQLLSLFRS